MIDFRRATFIKSAPTVSARPEPALPEIVFAGRSNVGKSSLINALTNHKIAKVSGKPGKTILLNYFNIDDRFYLVDAPGYGYTHTGTRHTDNFATMMDGYFHENRMLKGVLLLLDARRAPSDDDLAFHEYLQAQAIPIVLVYTKTDKVTQKEYAAFKKSLRDLGWTDAFVATTITERATIEPLQALIAKLLAA